MQAHLSEHWELGWKGCDEDMAFELILSLSFQGGRQTATSCDTAWQTGATDAQNELRDLRVRAWFRGELRSIAIQYKMPQV